MKHVLFQLMLLLSIASTHAQHQAAVPAPTPARHQECIVTPENPCSISSMTEPAYIYPGGKARCAFDDNKRIGSNATYKFEVMPGYGPNRNKIMIFFQGGGSCFNRITCNAWVENGLSKIISTITKVKALFQKKQEAKQVYGHLFAKNARSIPGIGVLNKTEARNPFRDWTIIIVVYCTADGHAGTAIRRTIAGDLHHYGAYNTEAVLDWTFRNFPAPERVIATGYSAGSLGALFWSKRIINQYKAVTPAEHIVILADSYVGFLPQRKQGKVLKTWGICDANVDWKPELQQQCGEGKLQFPDYMKDSIMTHPDVDFAFISTKNDIVQRTFFCLSKYGLNPFKINCLEPNEFYNGIKNILLSYIEAGATNILTYFPNGSQHGFIVENNYYSAGIGDAGPSINDWVTALTNKTQSTRVHSQCQPSGQNKLRCSDILLQMRT